MEAALILAVPGLVLPPRHALRLAALGIIAMLAPLGHGDTPCDPGAGHGLGVAILATFVALFFRVWRGPLRLG